MSGRHDEAAPGPRGMAGPRAEKSVSLALQGGGAHGAFTWGVLDAFLEDGRLAFEAVSGASAGAMNAVALANGWQEGGAEGARRKLADFWRKVSLDGSLSPMQAALMHRAMGFWPDPATSPANFWFGFLKSFTNPYDSNPLDINPLRDALVGLIDFDQVRACSQAKLYVSATNVHTGKVKIFRREEIGVDHVLASACLPEMFKAVEIEGVPYWDGGYSANPPLYPLFYGIVSDDIVLVQINPLERAKTPRTSAEIRDRMSEIVFNASLLRELRAVDFVTRLIDQGKLDSRDYKRVLMHRVAPTGHLDDFPASTRVRPSWAMFQDLCERGRRAGFDWLERHYDDIGVRPTLDSRREYD